MVDTLENMRNPRPIADAIKDEALTDEVRIALEIARQAFGEGTVVFDTDDNSVELDTPVTD